MSELKSVLLAIDVATRHRDDIGRLLAQVQQKRSGAKDQMEQLQSYATDTESRWALSSRQRATPEIMLHYHQFLDRLQQAVRLQAQVLATIEREFAEARKALLDADVRVLTLSQLLRKKRAALAKIQRGREQRQLDEFAAMQHRRQNAGIDTLESP